MPYDIEVLNASKETVARLSGTVTARLREKVNGIGTLTVETVEPREWEHFSVGTSFLRVRCGSGGTAATFRVMETRKYRERERTCLAVTACHILSDTAGEIFADAVNRLSASPAELMSLVLGHSAYAPGTVEPTAAVPFVRFEYEPVWACLMRICSLTGGELSLDEEAGEIDLLSAVGTGNGAVLRYGSNLKGASRTVGASMLANRVYGVGGGEPPLRLTGATQSGGKEYAEDATSIALYGLREAALHEPTLEEVVNLVATPALDGTYTGGLCQDWTNLGAVVSENTDPDGRLHGNASQRVQTTAAGQGIEQDVTVTAGGVYSLLANVIIASGTVRVLVQDGTSVYKREDAVTGTGLAAVRIENWKANNSTVTVQIVQEGGGTADFSVDSVQVAGGAHVKPFTVGKSADTLWERTTEFLAARKEPCIGYDVELTGEDAIVDPAGPGGVVGLGDTVTVIDEPLGIDVSTRVMEREVDLLRPWRVSVRLDNAAKSLTDVLAALRDAQEEGVRRMRETMAANASTAETDSSRLGFGRQTFRFFSTITADAWDAVSWSAGTLRVGNGYYAVGAGSATGLSANTTYWFYFDRTNPTVIAYTTTSSQAEGDDRILLFAAVTTVSPDLVTIHPLGIIHV